MLVAVRLYDHCRNGQTRWVFKCDCGTMKVIQKHHVIASRTKSCGCLKSKYIGTKFGNLKVVGYAKQLSKNVRVVCECDCGNIVNVWIHNLRSGKTVSCPECPGLVQRKPYEFMGRTLPLNEWAKIVGIDYQTLYQRKRAGWSIKRMLTEDVKKNDAVAEIG